MPTFYAHSDRGQTSPTDQWQPLRTHLAAVADLARRLADRTGVPDQPAAAWAAGWLHDLGKYQTEWQSYLFSSAAGQSPKTVPHSIHGAAHAFSELEHGPLAVCVLGRHTGLPDCKGETSSTPASKRTGCRRLCLNWFGSQEENAPSFRPRCRLPRVTTRMPGRDGWSSGHGCCSRC